MEKNEHIISKIMTHPYSLEQQSLSMNDDMDFSATNWLENAISFDVYTSNSKRLRILVDKVYGEVISVIKVSNAYKTKAVVKNVLINLWLSIFIGKPVMYSRTMSAYSRHRRYGQIFIKYHRIIPVIDTMERLGYLEQKIGFYLSNKNFGRQTRMWATSKLLQDFNTYRLKKAGFFSVSRPTEVIILRDGTKQNTEINYPDTPNSIQMREDLERYNDFIDNHQITLNLDGTVMTNFRFLIDELNYSIIRNTIKCLSLILNPTITEPIISNNQNINSLTDRYSKLSTTIMKYYHTVPSYITRKKYSEVETVLNYNDNNSSVMITDYLSELSRYVTCMPMSSDYVNEFMSQCFALRELGVEQIVLQLMYEYLHRVFNRKAFDLSIGGRAYGAIHQNIPKELRSYIRINGQKTVELDYSAYHILMLYHLEGIDYKDDPYLVCGGSEMRATYKAAALVAINAKNNKNAYGGIREELESRGIPIPGGKNPLINLVSRFKEAHPDIAKYICSDQGVRLMNIDSRIMNNILMKLMDRGILGLSVFDSVIVAEQHQDYLYQVMMEEYEKEMGFKPIVD